MSTASLRVADLDLSRIAGSFDEFHEQLSGRFVELGPAGANLLVVQGHHEDLDREHPRRLVHQATINREGHGLLKPRQRTRAGGDQGLHAGVPSLIVVGTGGQDQVLPAPVVPIEAPLGHAGLGGDGVHTDIVQAAFGKQPEGSLGELVTHLGCKGRHPDTSSSVD